MQPTLPDFVRTAVEKRVGEIHVAMPGSVETYDFATQNASVRPSLKKTYRDGRAESQPVIVGVPVVFPSAGGASLTFPVRRGDGVLLVFGERSLERWLSLGGEQEPGDPRKHDLTDAIAIPGLRHFGAGAQSDNAEDTLLRFAGGEVRIRPSGEVVMKGASKVALGAGGTEVLDVLEQLLAALMIAVTVGESEPLDQVPVFTVLRAQIAAIRGAL